MSTKFGGKRCHCGACTKVSIGETSCGWIGVAADKDSHFSNECVHKIVHCELCDETLLMKQLENHSKHRCEFRSVSCVFCANFVLLGSMQLHHNTDCGSFPVECSKCFSYVARDAMD